MHKGLDYRDLDDMKFLLEKVEAFQSEVYDWVACFDQVAMLEHLRDFKMAIKTGIDEIENPEPEAGDDFDPQAEWGTWNKPISGVK